jgi:hypothetical protein
MHDDDPAATGLTWEATPLQQLVVSMSRRSAAADPPRPIDLEEVSR